MDANSWTDITFFQPDYITINAVPDLNIKRDVPIVLGNINYEDSYDVILQ